MASFSEAKQLLTDAFEAGEQQGFTYDVKFNPELLKLSGKLINKDRDTTWSLDFSLTPKQGCVNFKMRF